MTYRTPPKYGKRVAPVLGWMEALAALNALASGWGQAPIYTMRRSGRG